MVQAMGAIFIIYSSATKAKSIFPACTVVDDIVAYNARSIGLKPLIKTHPLYEVFQS